MYTQDELMRRRDAGGDGWLAECAATVHSQFGEDGILAAVLATLPQRDGWCVEFGAWDGKHLSNTYRLIDEAGYSAVLIEADAKKFADLCRNFAAWDRVKPVNAYVGWDRASGLDAVLPESVPRDFDLLSIDIDGNDYHVWEAVEVYRPKVVIIEFNPTIATEVEFVQDRHPGVNQGASLLSITEMAKAKGYELVATTLANGVFVDRCFFSAFGIADNSPANLRRDLSQITHLFCGFDGQVFLRGNRTLPWHRMRYDEKRMQHLPAWCRRHPARYGRLQRLFWKLKRHSRAA